MRKQPDGKQARSKQSVAVALEPNATELPVVALMTPNKPTVVLSQPAASKPMAGALVVEAVETEPGGKLHVSGQARPGVALRLYLNDSFVASVTAGTDGRFAVTINEGVAHGSYRVRIDEVGSNSGAVRARAEVPFKVPDTATTSGPAQATSSKKPDIVAAQRPQLATAGTTVPPQGASPSTVVVPKIATTTVSRGDSLWRLSHLIVRCGHPLRSNLQGKPGADPQSQPDLSRPDLCPSDTVTRRLAIFGCRKCLSSTSASHNDEAQAHRAIVYVRLLRLPAKPEVCRGSKQQSVARARTRS